MFRIALGTFVATLSLALGAAVSQANPTTVSGGLFDYDRSARAGRSTDGRSCRRVGRCASTAEPRTDGGPGDLVLQTSSSTDSTITSTPPSWITNSR